MRSAALLIAISLLLPACASIDKRELIFNSSSDSERVSFFKDVKAKLSGLGFKYAGSYGYQYEVVQQPTTPVVTYDKNGVARIHDVGGNYTAESRVVTSSQPGGSISAQCFSGTGNLRYMQNPEAITDRNITAYSGNFIDILLDCGKSETITITARSAGQPLPAGITSAFDKLQQALKPKYQNKLTTEK